ncbi:MAG TPA: hypothetical protein VGP25_04770 [Gemmatimonadaceae bacterium]|nr:hypothetical protein [Gemmatimonadaceae bacterium]
MRADSHFLYGAAVCGVVAATSAAAAGLAASSGATPAWQALAALGAIPLGVRYAERIARPLVTRLVRPVTARLPRLTIDTTIPRALRTLVVVPAIVETPERARELLGHLARLARELDDPNIRFALLADFADATTRSTSSDAEILCEEQRLVERTNAELRDESGDRLFVLHRERSWHAPDRTWMGWERKRGKILELHRLLLGRSDTNYRWLFGAFASHLDAGGFPYVYTLDEANWLARGEVLSLLRVAAHPANRAQLDADTGRLVHGYAIFQPAVVPVSSVAYAGGSGATHVQRASGQQLAATRFYFDVLGVGVFQGKGLLDVRACHALLDDVFPPGAVLHHDLLEGFVARAAEVNDSFVLEASAPDYLSQVQRGHRWLRGYFQALPWVLPSVRGGNGSPRANPLRLIHRFFIIELVLAELSRPASLVLLIAGWLASSAHVAVWTVLVCPPLAVLLARVVFTALASVANAARRALLPEPHIGVPPRFPRPPLVADALAMVFSQATLPYEAVVVADALRRAASRVLVSRRHLLDWASVSRVSLAARPGAVREYRRVLRVCYATGLFTLAIVAAIRPAHLFIAFPFAIAWISAPWMAAWLDTVLGDPETQRAPDTPVARESRLAADRGIVPHSLPTHASDLARLGTSDHRRDLHA